MEKPGVEVDNDRKFDNGVFSGSHSNQIMQYAPSHTENCCQYKQGVRYPEYKNKDNKDNKDNAVLIFSVAAAVFMALVAFLLTLIFLLCIFKQDTKQNKQGSDIFKNMPYEEEVPNSQNSEREGDVSKQYYTELKDSIRTDLDYFIEWKNYEYEENDGKITIEIDYPVIGGDAPNKDILNEIIVDEIVYFQEYFEAYSEYMLTDEIFNVYSEGYVTYMDEGVMSVVFCEQINTDYWQDYGLYCINIDMTNGVVINNSSILRIDDAFVQDFKEKSGAQNGNDLDKMTDQQIMYYLTDEKTSIIFYTPVGMEVGMNFDEGFLTVTYQDYEPYMQKY
ncbi:MAG: hypothetical protein GX235_06895 [Clostridiales bacterium]|nr:hypothetical protein [Clostridiales bacterium]